jgi:hypothetical protein
MKPEMVHSPTVELPKSCLGPDGKIPPMTEEERRLLSQALRETLEAIAQIPDDDPPGSFEEFMRGVDERRPHRPILPELDQAGARAIRLRHAATESSLAAVHPSRDSTCARLHPLVGRNSVVARSGENVA